MTSIFNSLFVALDEAVASWYGRSQLGLVRPDAPEAVVATLRWVCGLGGHELRSGRCKWCGHEERA